MSAPEFDPALVEKAALALDPMGWHYTTAAGREQMLASARAVLTAVADDLRAEVRDDPLDRFIAYADRLDSLMGARNRPAYAETCCCGASMEIGCDVSARERSQTARLFIARHQHCTQPGRNADIDTEDGA